MQIHTEMTDKLKEKIRAGAVFIYPTDTVYGIGCDATNSKAVDKVRKLKEIDDRPLSIIVPSKEWIRKYLITDDEIDEWIEKLPGPYTLVLRSEQTLIIEQVRENVAPKSECIGVRIPDHWISDTVEELGFPIVTTSVNKTGKTPLYSIEDLDESIRDGVDFMIDQGALYGKPSDIVMLCEEEKHVVERIV